MTKTGSVFRRQTNSRLGIMLMFAGMFLFSAVDTQTKYLTTTFHPVQIIWFRQLGLLIGVLLILAMKGPSILRTQQPRLQIARGAMVICSSLLFVFAVRYAPLADAVAASFVAPFFLTIMGATLLGEKVGIRRWTAVVIGFIGALVIIRPGMGVIHPAVMLVVVAAFLYASRQIIGRLLADTDRTVTTIAYTAIIGSALITLPLPFIWQTPAMDIQFVLLISIAILAGVAEVLVIKALEVSEAMVVAPIHYTLIIWGTLYGYFVFEQLPDIWTWIGTAVIVLAGLYTLKRDSLAKE